MSSRTSVVVSLEQDRLFAICASVGRDRVRIKSWLSAQMPAGMDARDPQGVGRWMAEELKNRGLTRAGLVVGVPRNEVVLKWMKLPAGAADDAELASMVRLQLARQLTMGIDATAIDYAPLQPPAAGESAEVLAAAVPTERLTWIRHLARAAGMRLERVAPKALGLVGLLAGVSDRRSGAVLGIAVGWSSVEFVVVRDGQLVFARSADVGLADRELADRRRGDGGDEGGGDGAAEPDAEREFALPMPDSGSSDGGSAFVHRAAVEAKRTWMSYRMQPDSAEVDAVVILGDGALARELGRGCGEALEMAHELVGAPAAVELPRDMPEAERLVAAPLIGLLADRITGRPTLDFVHPRRPRDTRAGLRQRVLLGAFAAVVLVGGGLVWSSMQLSRMRGELAALQQRQRQLQGEFDAFLGEQARWQHLSAWLRTRVDWLDHLRWISDQMPDPREATLDALSGSLQRAIVRFVPKDGRFQGGTWDVARGVAMSLSGRSRSRVVADQLRDRLVASQAYTVESRGADVPDRFRLELSTGESGPTAHGARGVP